MSHKDGWNFINSNDNSHNDDGSWEYSNSDGSSSYYGADGSWGYKNSDGSGSFYGEDGSWGYSYSDGSGTFFESDGYSSISKPAKEDTPTEFNSVEAGAALGTLIGNGIVFFMDHFSNKDSEDFVDDEEDDDDDDDELYADQEPIKRRTSNPRNTRNSTATPFAFCVGCGCQISINCKFCPACGRDLSLHTATCKKCGHTLRNAAKFCSICGNPVAP
jgi:hypothetical protein